jgi:hypothetical protein
MSWRPAHCLNVLREQVDAAFPDRPQGADGMIGDARHQAEKSDHNPNGAGIVTAWDITTDERFTDALAEQLRQLGEGKDGRVKYVIFKGRIAGPTNRGWKWRPYSGFSQHFDHIHLSVAGVPAQYDRTDPWPVLIQAAPTPEDDMPLTDDDVEKVADRVFDKLRAYVATHQDMVVLLRGTADGKHAANLTSIARALKVKDA